MNRSPFIHRLREGYKEERTACINRIRGLLAEFGLVPPQSPKALREVMADVIEDAANELGYLARLALQRAHLHWLEIETHIAWVATSASLFTSRPTRRRRA